VTADSLERLRAYESIFRAIRNGYRPVDGEVVSFASTMPLPFGIQAGKPYTLQVVPNLGGPGYSLGLERL
jgi:hypothetical protein